MFCLKVFTYFFSAEKDENIEEIQFYTGGDPEIKIETVGTISNEFNDGNAVEVSLCYNIHTKNIVRLYPWKKLIFWKYHWGSVAFTGYRWKILW